MNSILSIIWIMPLVLYLKSHFNAWNHLDFLLCYLLRLFLVLHFMFRSMNYCEFIFVKSIRVCVWINFLAFGCPVVLEPKEESQKTLFSIVLPLLLRQRPVDSIYVSLFLGSILFHWSVLTIMRFVMGQGVLQTFDSKLHWKNEKDWNAHIYIHTHVYTIYHYFLFSIHHHLSPICVLPPPSNSLW